MKVLITLKFLNKHFYTQRMKMILHFMLKTIKTVRLLKDYSVIKSIKTSDAFHFLDLNQTKVNRK